MQNVSVIFFLIQKPLLIITNKVQGTRQAYIKNTNILQKATMHYRNAYLQARDVYKN